VSTILIVGATSGVGRATAIQLAAHGHRVLALGRDPDRAHDLGRQLGAPADTAAIDVSHSQGWTATADWVHQ
jgi:NAD(P)-dependent dehydrogenase (short-subunit alcohol dehydrogenase family)